MRIELTGPNWMMFVLGFPDDSQYVIGQARIRVSDTEIVDGPQIAIPPLGSFQCRESYEYVKDLFMMKADA